MSLRVHVVGPGEVGSRLAGALERDGLSVHRVGRASGWEDALDPADDAPRIVAVREEQLAGVLERFPAALHPRLVLVQNGFLEAVHGALAAGGRGLIWFTSKGDFFEVLCPSIFRGGASDELVPALVRGGIAAEVVRDRDVFLRAMIVKGVWNAVVGLPLHVHGVDLATYLSERRDELDALADESARACGAAYGVELQGAAVVEQILATTSKLGWVRGGAKALAWRNGAIARFGRRHGVPTPVNDRLLRAVGYDPDGAQRGATPTSG